MSSVQRYSHDSLKFVCRVKLPVQEPSSIVHWFNFHAMLNVLLSSLKFKHQVCLENWQLVVEGNAKSYKDGVSIYHSISNRKFCCFSCKIVMVHQNSPTVEFWQEKIEGNLRRANMEPSVDFRKANTEQSVHFRRANMEIY